jgi:hypothetical protein
MRTSKKVPLQGFQNIAERILEQVLEVQGVLNRLLRVPVSVAFMCDLPRL